MLLGVQTNLLSLTNSFSNVSMKADTSMGRLKCIFPRGHTWSIWVVQQLRSTRASILPRDLEGAKTYVIDGTLTPAAV